MGFLKIVECELIGVFCLQKCFVIVEVNEGRIEENLNECVLIFNQLNIERIEIYLEGLMDLK